MNELLARLSLQTSRYQQITWNTCTRNTLELPDVAPTEYGSAARRVDPAIDCRIFLCDWLPIPEKKPTQHSCQCQCSNKIHPRATLAWRSNWSNTYWMGRKLANQLSRAIFTKLTELRRSTQINAKTAAIKGTSEIPIQKSNVRH